MYSEWLLKEFGGIKNIKNDHLTQITTEKKRKREKVTI